MKQLLSCCSSSSSSPSLSGGCDDDNDDVFVVGLKDCAYAVLRRRSSSTSVAATTTTVQQQQQQRDIVVAMLPPTTTTTIGGETSGTEVSGSGEAAVNTTTQNDDEEKSSDEQQQDTASAVSGNSEKTKEEEDVSSQKQQTKQQQQKKRKKKKNSHDDNTKNKDIDAVAIYKHHHSSSSNNNNTKLEYWCAVTRMDKSLEIYNFNFFSDELDNNDNEKATTTSTTIIIDVQPKLTYKTPKRVGCMCFTDLPTIEDSNSNTEINSSNIPCLVVGDVSGDSYAYGIEQRGRRLLLGHTASMITGICCINNNNININNDKHQTQKSSTSKQKLLITADRDEKIRISNFPQTYNIDDYLLGHDAYITAIDFGAFIEIENNAGGGGGKEGGRQVLTSCGGDSTIRLWDINSLKQIGQIDVGGSIIDNNGNNDDEEEKEDVAASAKTKTETALIPTDLAISKDGKKIGVIFDESNKLDIYKVAAFLPGEDNDDDKGGGEVSLKLIQTIVCPSQPLSVSFLGSGSGNNKNSHQKEDMGEDDEVLVVVQDPDYVLGYKLKNENVEDKEKSVDSSNNPSSLNMDGGLDMVRQLAKESKLIMPTTILEKDETGQPKLKKITETRGPSREDQPWNRVERLENEKKRNERRKKRRQEEAQKRDEAAQNKKTKKE